MLHRIQLAVSSTWRCVLCLVCVASRWSSKLLSQQLQCTRNPASVCGVQVPGVSRCGPLEQCRRRQHHSGWYKHWYLHVCVELPRRTEHGSRKGGPVFSNVVPSYEITFTVDLCVVLLSWLIDTSRTLTGSLKQGVRCFKTAISIWNTLKWSSFCAIHFDHCRLVCVCGCRSVPSTPKCWMKRSGRGCARTWPAPWREPSSSSRSAWWVCFKKKKWIW